MCGSWFGKNRLGIKSIGCVIFRVAFEVSLMEAIGGVVQAAKGDRTMV